MVGSRSFGRADEKRWLKMTGKSAKSYEDAEAAPRKRIDQRRATI